MQTTIIVCIRQRVKYVSGIRRSLTGILSKNIFRGDGGQVMMRNGIVPDVSKRKKIEFLEAIGNK